MKACMYVSVGMYACMNTQQFPAKLGCSLNNESAALLTWHGQSVCASKPNWRTWPDTCCTGHHAEPCNFEFEFGKLSSSRTAYSQHIRTHVRPEDSFGPSASACMQAARKPRPACHACLSLSRPEVLLCNKAIRAISRRQWQQALKCLTTMEEEQLEPDVVTFCSAANVCGKASQWQWALHFLTMARVCTIWPNEVFYNAVISSCEKLTHWKRAVLLVADIEKGQLRSDVISYSAMIAACGAAVEWQHAVASTRTMFSKTIQAGIFTLNTAISACRKSAWPRSLFLLTTTSCFLLESDAVSFNAGIGAAVHEPQQDWIVSLALLSMQSCQQLRPNNIAFNSMLSVCEQVHAWQIALSLMLHMQRGHSELEPDVVTYNSAISSCEKAQQWQLALLLFGKLQEKRIVPEHHHLQCGHMCTRTVFHVADGFGLASDPRR